MALTQQQRFLRQPDHFPTWQLFILAIVRLGEPIAITNLFPYAWKIVMHFDVGTQDTAAFWTGVLIAAFSFAEALTSFHWGSLSDRVGRRPVLISGCLGTCLCLFIVGFSQNFWMALIGRLLGGLLNGNIGVIQTCVGELITDPKHEPTAYAVLPFVWSVGTILGPMIGGILSEPAENYPDTFSHDGVFARYPYLLPNLVCAGLVALSVTFAYFFLVETHPSMQSQSKEDDGCLYAASTLMFPASGTLNNAKADRSIKSYGTFDFNTIKQQTRRKSIALSKNSSRSFSPSSHAVFTKNVVMLVVALAIFTFHSMTCDTLIPIFAQDLRQTPSSKLSGGLGLTIQDVGFIMSVNGGIALVVQGVVFPYIASRVRILPLTVVVTVAHPIIYFLMPFLILVPKDWVYLSIYMVLSLRNLFAILAYPLLLILIKEAAPSAHLGKINGLAASAGAVARMLASLLSGLLYSVGSRIHFAGVAWWASALVALVGSVHIFFVGRQKDNLGTAHVASAAAQAENPVQLSCQKSPREQKAQVGSRYYDDSGYASEVQ